MNNIHADHAPGQNKTTMVVINGRQREVSGHKISYSQLVQLAFPGDQKSETIGYTVDYSNPHGKDGSLVDGEEVHIKEGMIFNVTKTNRS